VTDSTRRPFPEKNERSSAAMDELRRRLSRIGIDTGQNFTPRPRQVGQPLEELVQGTITETEHGPSFRVTRIYPSDTLHGTSNLGAWLTQTSDSLARVGGDHAIGRADLRRFVFLDTETTGLGSGTGTFAFLVGIGFFNDQDAFEVHQFFLRDPAEEMAMLTLLHEIIWPDGRLVTFNGRTFDIPLLSDRYIMSRLRTHVTRLPNLDLLHPARRLWKRRLASCRLSALEVDILGLNRASNDVPGHLIPYLYREYLRTGNGHDMIRVLYHNEQDILSMVSLGVTLARAFDEPEAPTLHIEDRLSLARWYAKRGMLAECETAYRLALDECPDEQTRYDALAGLSEMLKRIGRAQEAISLWEYIADLKFDTFGHEELAKYYEWQTKDLHTALLWTESGIALTETWRPGLRRTEAVRSLEARRSRLIRKIKTRPG
jgi:uncharacterized protein